MIELNLLPDVKLEYIKAERQKRLVLSVAVLVTAGSIALLLILLSVSGLQKKHMSDLTQDIKQESSQLAREPQIAKILTVQNQLRSLTDLHEAKPAVSRLFEYLNEVTPAKASISTYSTDFTTNTATITGSADALSTVNQYVDTLKFTKYGVEGDSSQTPAFSNIVLTSFSLNSASTDKARAASYTITLEYDPAIFDLKQKIVLDVPKQVTTRARIEQPDELFKSVPTNTTKSAGAQ